MAKYGFKTDTRELKQWLAKRKASLESSRQPIETLWKDIRDNIEPNHGKALIEGDPNQRSADRDDRKILNSEPRILLQRMAAGLQSGITNQARDWFRLQSRDSRTNKGSAARGWLDFATESLLSTMARSNVYTALDQIYAHLGEFGTSAALMVYDDVTTLHVHVCDEGSYWIAQNRRDRVDVLMRRIDFTLSQMVDEFGKGWIPDRIVEKMNDKGALEQNYIVWNLVCPVEHCAGIMKDVSKGREFVSVYWLEGMDGSMSNGGKGDGNDGILAIRSFGFNPILAPRWSIGSSVYGIGCGQMGLADSKELQRLEKDKLKLVEQEVDPSMYADSSMKGIPINTGPGGITYVNTALNGGKVIPVGRLFETNNQIQALLLAIDSVEGRLRRIFFSDLFAMMINLNLAPKKQMTATEVNELSSEKVALLGPVLTRLNTDLLDPLVDAVFSIMIEKAENEGEDPYAEYSLTSPPDSLQGEDLKVEYVSSLHIEQQSASRLTGLSRLLEFSAQVASVSPEVSGMVIDKLDTDKMIDVAAESLVEHGCVRDKKDVDAIRNGRAQAAMQAQKAEQDAKQLQAAGSAIKNMATAPVGQGSVLDAAMGGGEGLEQ